MCLKAMLGGVWRKVPESDARRSVEEGAGGAGKRWSECGGRCRKAMLGGVWRKVPESDARSVEEGAGKRCSECGGSRPIDSPQSLPPGLAHIRHTEGATVAPCTPPHLSPPPLPTPLPPAPPISSFLQQSAALS